MSKLLILLLASIAYASAQGGAFELGKFSNVAESILERRGYAPKPTVPPEYRKFFELDGHARELVDSLLGPRPGGLFPEKTYEIGQSSSSSGSGAPHQISNLERTLESFFTAPENSGPAFPGSFGGNGGGFSLINDNKNLAQFGSNVRRAPQKEASAEVEDEAEGSGESSGSSIAGIPNVFPKIPLSPFLSQNKPEPKPEIPIMTNADAEIPAIATNPEVPDGGLLPTSDIRRAPQNLMTAPSTPEEEEHEEDLADRANSSGGLIGTIFKLIGMTGKNKTAAATGEPEDKNALGRAVSNLIGGQDSPLPAKGMISNVLYNALTAPAQNSTSEKNNGTLVLTDAQSAAIGENLEMVKNLIIQPSSPLCTSKPEPVDFVLDSMMGQWYQVVYSPPLSSGPCSMVGYKKLSSVNDGGVGSIFEIFEYTTDGSQYAKPKISSGYAIVKSPGELIFRTTNNQEDVLVHVVHIGPVNSANEYEYVVMSTNCNYPIYVFARDPITYKQKYEDRVNRYLESANLVNGISRLLNIVAPVETSMCSFPPSLFNMAH